jgi:glycolate oxidase FAD binding subunit
MPLFRISVPPSKSVEAIEKLAPASWFADGAGAILWCAFQKLDARDTLRIHQIAREFGGHATLYRAPGALRAEIDVFPPLDPATMALTRQLKNAFDPAGILNPGRMYKDA